MPQASDEDRALMTKWFGDIGDSGPLLLLLSHGFRDRGGRISKPTPNHTLNGIEYACILFLIHEWDYDFAELVRDAYKDPQP